MEMMKNLLTYLEGWNGLSVAVRLILAALMGGIIGMERGATKHAAGLRTFTLVCLGAALAQIVDLHCVLLYGTGDPVRLAQGVISGIGFLGVGTIIVTGKSHIKGLTTAATLWTTAVLGISIGAGYIYASLLTFALVMIVIKAMAGVSHKHIQYHRLMRIEVEVSANEGARGVAAYLREHGYHITDMERKQCDDHILLGLDIDLGGKRDHNQIIEEINRLDAVDFATEIF